MNLAFSVIKHLDFGGGIERYTRELATRLARRGHRVEVFSMSHYGPHGHEREGVRIVRVPCVPGVATEKLSASFSAAAACALRRIQAGPRSLPQRRRRRFCLAAPLARHSLCAPDARGRVAARPLESFGSRCS